MFSYMKVYCSICDFMKRYGKIDGDSCCSKECYKEFDWRRVLSIMGKIYYPQENKE